MKQEMSPSKFGLKFDKAYYMQAKEEYERHFRPDEEEYLRYMSSGSQRLEYIRKLYQERFEEDISSKERVFKKPNR